MGEEALAVKEAGNTLFRDGHYEDAVEKYTEALNLSKAAQDKAVIYRNRAACYLKLNRYKPAVDDCTQALEVCCNDPKALFRRCQAYESLGKLDDAFKDAMHLLKVEPKNKSIQPVLARLSKAVQERAKKQETTDSKVEQMFEFSENGKDMEKVIQAVNNLVALSKDEYGVERILAQDGLGKLKTLLYGDNAEVELAALRALSNIAKTNKDRAYLVYESITLKAITTIMSKTQPDVSTAAAHLIQTPTREFSCPAPSPANPPK